MADASCSGGTPFKRLVDHQGRDVSHHQDRLVDRTGVQQHGSFRSAQQPLQGQDGFAAFMDGPATLPGLPQQHLHHHHAASRLANHAAALDHSAAHFTPPPMHVQQAGGADVSNWAADFNRFNSQMQQRAPLQNAFAQPAVSQPMLQHQQPLQPFQPQFNFQSAFGQPHTAFAPGASSAQADFDQEMSRWMASHGGGGGNTTTATTTTQGTEEIDAVMDQMARDLAINESVLKSAETAAQDTRNDEPVALGKEPDTHTETQNSSLQPADEATMLEEEPAHEDAAIKSKSEVSDAAERLLESVQHEDGDKWKNSVFLSLMRDFRDGRKDIVDNEIRETPQDETVTATPH